MVSRAKQFLKETAPSLFYHASFTANKNDILDNGLSSGLGYNWKDWSEKLFIIVLHQGDLICTYYFES